MKYCIGCGEEYEGTHKCRLGKINRVLANKKRNLFNQTEHERFLRQIRKEELEDRMNLFYTRNCVEVWRVVLENAERFTEATMQEFEKLMLDVAKSERGPETILDLDRGMQSVTVVAPDGTRTSL